MRHKSAWICFSNIFSILWVVIGFIIVYPKKWMRLVHSATVPPVIWHVIMSSSTGGSSEHQSLSCNQSVLLSTRNLKAKITNAFSTIRLALDRRSLKICSSTVKVLCVIWFQKVITHRKYVVTYKTPFLWPI